MLTYRNPESDSPSTDTCVFVFGGFNRFNFLNTWQRHHEITSRIGRNTEVVWIEWLPFSPGQAHKYLFNVLKRLMPWRRQDQLSSGEAPSVFWLPTAIPLGMGNRWVRNFNMRRMRAGVKKLARGRRPLAWIYQPTAFARDAVAFGLFEYSVYDCVQDFGTHPYPPAADAYDKEIAASVDTAFCDAEQIRISKAAVRPDMQLVPQGWPRELMFSESNPTSDGLCYLGSFHCDFDLGLLCEVASSLPGTRISVAGPFPERDRSVLPSNIEVVGLVARADRADYLRRHKIGIIPYRQSRHAMSVLPTKLFEYLAAGLGVVSTPLPEVARFEGPCVAVPGEATAWARSITDMAARVGSRDFQEQRERILSGGSWDDRFQAMIKHLESSPFRGMS